MGFCPSCGTKSADESSRFCHKCGAALVVEDIEEKSVGSGAHSAEVAVATASGGNSGVRDSDDDGQRTSAHEKGLRLELTVEGILKAQGYSTKHLEKVGVGKTSEIDIVATRVRNGQTETVLVECKNYSTPVPVKEVQAFHDKLTKFGFKNGLFAAEPRFSREARQWGVDYRMILWDSDEMKELHWRASIGRLGVSESSRLPRYIPLLVEYDRAVALDFNNKERIGVVDAALVWKPYYKVLYDLKCSRTDPARHAHVIEDSGTIVVDSLSGRVLARTSKMKSFAKRLLGQSDEEAQDTNETEAVLDELETEAEKDLVVSKAQDYRTIVHKPLVSEDRVRRGATKSVIDWNDQLVSYKLRQDEDDPFADEREFRITPSPKDVRLSVELVYVPEWEFEYLSGEYKYVKSITGNGGATIYDTITHCGGHALAGFTHKKNVAVCDVCGKAACKEHVRKCSACGSWRCESHCKVCVDCGSAFCPEHMQAVCAECGSSVCQSCAKSCALCGQMHCRKHMTVCSKCHKTVCTSCTRKEGGFLSLGQKVLCTEC